jgi:hypothetical protein
MGIVPTPDRIIFPTAYRSGAFLGWAWSQRNAMSDSQRQGLAQAIYASLVAHIEATIAEILVWEYRQDMRFLSHHAKSPSSVLHQRAFGRSVSVLLERQKELEKMTFKQLLEELEFFFYPRYEQGPKRHKLDLEALMDLRNLFAHGRAPWLPLASETQVRIDTDGNKLKKALDRLVTAGIVTNETDTVTSGDAMGADEKRLFEKLHSDSAVRYFCDKARCFQIEVCSLASQFEFNDEFPNLD